MKADFAGLAVTVMGLGLNGGGLEAARFLAGRGARVTVTDLRGEDVLRPSLERLAGLPIRCVLGRHEMSDFEGADLVVKNPAVPSSSPFLKAARRIETDLSIFLGLCPAPVLAVTGSKGKSSTTAAIHHALRRRYPEARVGGNITTSPLSFVDELGPEAPVVLELSSWQLGDLRGRGLLRPRAAVITNIYPDHQDRYGSMEPYVDDKSQIFRDQPAEAATVLNYDDPYGRRFAEQTPGRVLFFSAVGLPAGPNGAFLNGEEGFLRAEGRVDLLVPGQLLVVGDHMRLNLLAAGLAAHAFGLETDLIREALGDFKGIEHRLELVAEKNGVRYYNDSAATIPQALVAAVKSLEAPLHLITGGTDKNLDFAPLSEVAGRPREFYLLEGSATIKIMEVLRRSGRSWRGPYAALDAAVRDAAEAAEPGEAVALSPGCTSFGMFLNEFDRGRKFKAIVAGLH